MATFTNFVVKIHELCNINCTYCYMYNLKDKSFEDRPRMMSEETRDTFFSKLASHIKAHSLGDIVVYLHGGEPLLVGKRYFMAWVDTLKEVVGSLCNVIVIVQTNGMLIDDEWIEIFYQRNIRVGISLDGPQRFHDEFRVTASGKGTFAEVFAAVRRLKEHRLGEYVFGSILTVANPKIPPQDLWDTWRSTGFTRFDFNLPHCTHDSPPWFSQAELTTWLTELFDLWWQNDDPNFDIRFFRNILHLMLGATSSTDYIGGTQVGIVVIETDGSIQGTDALRACENGLTNVNMNVYRNHIHEAMSIPLVRDCNHGSQALCSKCRSCEVREVCGGGYFPHRYRRASLFDNPSIYCESLFAIINYIRSIVVRDSNGIFESYNTQSTSTERIGVPI